MDGDVCRRSKKAISTSVLDRDGVDYGAAYAWNGQRRKPGAGCLPGRMELADDGTLHGVLRRGYWTTFGYDSGPGARACASEPDSSTCRHTRAWTYDALDQVAIGVDRRHPATTWARNAMAGPKPRSVRTESAEEWRYDRRGNARSYGDEEGSRPVDLRWAAVADPTRISARRGCVAEDWSPPRGRCSLGNDGHADPGDGTRGTPRTTTWSGRIPRPSRFDARDGHLRRPDLVHGPNTMAPARASRDVYAYDTVGRVQTCGRRTTWARACQDRPPTGWTPDTRRRVGPDHRDADDWTDFDYDNGQLSDEALASGELVHHEYDVWGRRFHTAWIGSGGEVRQLDRYWERGR